jgi:hypothetical protein
MDNDSDKGEFVDVIYSLEEIRANHDLPPEALIAIEKAHEIFLRNVAEHPEIALQAYAYGITIGAYFGPRDEEVMAEADRLLYSARQSLSGKASGEKRSKRPWHKPAEDLTVEIRRKKPWLSQNRLAAEIADRWTSSYTCPGTEMLEKLVSGLERDGKLR